MIKCLICCGGTGGHLSPGIALAEALHERHHECILVVSNKEVDSRLLRKYPDLNYVRTPGRPFSLNPLKFVAFLFTVVAAFGFAVRLIRKERPNVLVGFGGFSTVGMALAAFLFKIPVVLHEANRVPGKAVRFLSAIASRLYLPQGVKLHSFIPKAVRHYGFPLRKDIMHISPRSARKALDLKVQGRLLLVFGGSQGATALNQWVQNNFGKLAMRGINIYCVTGLNKEKEDVWERKLPDGRVIRCWFKPFCDDMANLLSAADLTVARAGAGSIAEFMRCRLPSILVPYPHAADNHQQENAIFHEKQGGAIVLPQDNLDSLYNEIADLIHNDPLLLKMRKNLELLDRSNSIDHMMNDLEDIINWRASFAETRKEKAAV